MTVKQDRRWSTRALIIAYVLGELVGIVGERAVRWLWHVVAMTLLSACTAAIHDPVDGSVLAKCYDGVLISFCQVRQPPGTVVTSAGGIVPTAGSVGIVTAVSRP